jgi:ABC-type Fe3+ transport system substrate-binding protein
MRTYKKTKAVLGLWMIWLLPAPAFAASAAEWDKTLAAAKKEGEVVVSALSGELLRQVLMSFEQDYPGIKVKYQSGNLRDLWPLVYKEREMGQYHWDVRVGGVDAATYEAKDRGLLDPIAPVLMLPEVLDDKKWIGGLSSLYGDKEKKYVIHVSGLLSGDIVVNRDSIPEGQIKSPKELTDPRWKGKILMQEPREGGSGTAALAALLQQYGEPFVRDLLKNQAVVISDNRRQMAEWVVRQRYPIAIGLGTAGPITQFQKEGLGKNIKPIPGYDTIGGNTVILFSKAPHPNAAKVYVNWLLSEKAQRRLAEIGQTNSRRFDVKPGNPELALDPKRISKYLDISDEKYAPIKVRAQELAKELLP